MICRLMSVFGARLVFFNQMLLMAETVAVQAVLSR